MKTKKQEPKKKSYVVQKTIAFLFALGLWTQGAVWFFSHYELQTPIKIQSPIRDKYLKVVPSEVVPTTLPELRGLDKPTATPTPKKRSSIKGAFIGPVYAAEYSISEVDTDKIYRLESSGGKNDSCRNQGKYNGYGFGQSTFAWNCFDSHEEVENKVQAWFDDKEEKGFTLDEALCYYNQGIKQEGCQYAINYHSL